MHGRQENRLSTRRGHALRRHGTAKLAGALAVVALAVPAAAAGYAAPGNPTGSTASSPGAASDRYGALVLHRDGSKAVPFVVDVGPGHTTSGDAFDWGDAMIGAGAVLGMAALGAAGLTLRRRTAVGPGSVATES
jgi:hypothetical protein